MRRMAICKPGRESSPDTRSAGTLILDFPTVRAVTVVSNKFLLFKSPSPCYLVTAAWAKTHGMAVNSQPCQTWLQIPALSLISWMVLGKSLSLSKPQFILLWNGDYNSSYIPRFLWRFHKMMYVKSLHSEWYILGTGYMETGPLCGVNQKSKHGHCPFNALNNLVWCVLLFSLWRWRKEVWVDTWLA